MLLSGGLTTLRAVLAGFLLAAILPAAKADMPFCLITMPLSPGWKPPAPYFQVAGEGSFWFGTDGLWTSLPIDGEWHGAQNERGYRNKMFLWSKGFNWRKEHDPALTITGRRLDRDAPSFEVTGASAAFISRRDAAALSTAFEIPESGCWELTARFHGNSLTFVTLVRKQ